VAYPLSAAALEAAFEAKRRTLIVPVLVGPGQAIAALARQSAIDLGGVEIHETPDDPVSAARASVSLCRDKRADLIMKGSLHTDELLGAVVAKEGGLRTGRRISHAFYFDVPGRAKPLLMADCVVNIQPDLMVKRDIIQNAVDLAHALGTAKPLVAILSAVETVNPAIPGTIEAAALSKMADRGQITGAVVDGPLAFDNAISADAAKTKGIVSPVAGQPDILITPNLEAGNMLYKELVYLGKAECAGVILGTKVPIVLTSRADSALCRVASCALAVIRAGAQR
jgi:phosphate acetyltransferase